SASENQSSSSAGAASGSLAMASLTRASVRRSTRVRSVAPLTSPFDERRVTLSLMAACHTCRNQPPRTAPRRPYDYHHPAIDPPDRDVTNLACLIGAAIGDRAEPDRNRVLEVDATLGEIREPFRFMPFDIPFRRLFTIFRHHHPAQVDIER